VTLHVVPSLRDGSSSLRFPSLRLRLEESAETTIQPQRWLLVATKEERHDE